MSKKMKPYVTLLNSVKSYVTVFLEYKARRTLNQILRPELEESLRKKAKHHNGVFVGSDVDYLNKSKIIWFDFENARKAQNFIKNI